MRKLLSVFILLLAFFSEIYAKEYIIGVVPKTMYIDYWEKIEEGATTAGNDLKVKIIYRGPSYEEDADIQIKIMEELINSKVDAIVLAPADKDKLIPTVKKAMNNGIKIVIIDSALGDKSYDSYVATDNYLAGKIAGEELLKIVKDKQNIMVLKLKKGNSSTEERESGFIDAVKNGGGVVKYSEYGGTTLGDTSRKAEKLIKSNNISGIFMSNAILTEGVMIAFKKHNIKNIVGIGFDSNENIKEAINSEYLTGVIIQNPYKIGYRGVKIAVDILNGIKVEKRVIVESSYIDKSRITELK